MFVSSDTIGGFSGLLVKAELRASSGRLFSYNMLCAIWIAALKCGPDWLLSCKKFVWQV